MKDKAYFKYGVFCIDVNDEVYKKAKRASEP